MNQSTNFTTAEYHWYSTPSKGVAYELIENSSNKHFNKDWGDKVYTQYNYRTTTTRPSNRFGGVNFAALNKDNGCRKTFIPENDKLLEIDISAYHPTLASSLIHYTFDDGDIHKSFAKMYGSGLSESQRINI